MFGKASNHRLVLVSVVFKMVKKAWCLGFLGPLGTFLDLLGPSRTSWDHDILLIRDF